MEANLLGKCDLCRDIEAVAGGFLSNLRVYARQSPDFSWNSTLVSQVCAKYTSMVTPAWHFHNLVLQLLWVLSLKSPHWGEIHSWSQSWQLSVSQKNQVSAFPASLGSSRFARISDLGKFFLRYRRGTTNMQCNQSRGRATGCWIQPDLSVYSMWLHLDPRSLRFPNFFEFFSQVPHFLHSVILTASKRVLSAAAISGESCNKIQAEFPASYLWAYTAAPQSLANIWDYCE